jgi:SAM-dependent methyltransferase
MTETLVKDYYTTQVHDEWRRLIQDAYHRLEFQTTLRFLEKYLPKKGLILDAGSGPGRYTLDLARRGYQVVLLDLTPANLDFARRQIKRHKLQKQVESFVEGSIVDLSQFKSNSFDAIICLGGPLSHVVNAQSRDQAIAELLRLTRPGAPLFVSVMSRLSQLAVELALFQHEIEMPLFKEIRDTGDYYGGSGFTACHFFLPEELRQAFEKRGATVLEMVGLEGIGAHQARKVNQLAKNELRWKIWLETHYKTCTHPTVVGIAEHMLIVCKKDRALS